MFGRFAAPSLDAPSSAVEPLAPRSYRHKLRTLAYVSLDSGGAGIIRDLGGSGLAMQTATPLAVGDHVEVRLDLSAPRCHVDAIARIVWTDSTAQSGLTFLSISARSARALNEWILTQLLADASHVAGEGELLFSTAIRPVIRLQPVTPRFKPGEEKSALRVLGLPISPLRFARLVDGLVLLCAVLLFGLISLFLIDVLPRWTFTVLFLTGVTAVFAGLYWFLFAIWFGTTPGSRLAALAGAAAGEASVPSVPPARFR